ncbi:hypothetical protein Bca101_076666 [Brassica carinata]
MQIGNEWSIVRKQIICILKFNFKMESDGHEFSNCFIRRYCRHICFPPLLSRHNPCLLHMGNRLESTRRRGDVSAARAQVAATTNCRAHTETNMEELRQRRKRYCKRSLNLGCLCSGEDVAKRIRQGDLRETTVA